MLKPSSRINSPISRDILPPIFTLGDCGVMSRVSHELRTYPTLHCCPRRKLIRRVRDAHYTVSRRRECQSEAALRRSLCLDLAVS